MTTTVEAPSVDALDAGVIEDARRHQRRQWRRAAIGLLVAALLGGVAAIAAVAISGSSSGTVPADAIPGGLPTGAPATLYAAGPLAVGPNGALYVADVAGDRILVRLPDGRFRVVAGDGKIGFSGDGGPAVDAELSSVSDLAFSPTGGLYVADGGRVRVIGRDGVIRTIAGDGRSAPKITNGTPALSDPLGAGRSRLHIALSRRGDLYISTGWRREDGGQMLRLTAAGRLDIVRAAITSGRDRRLPLGGAGPIAVDAHGNIDFGGGPGGWAVWQITPDGIAHLVSGSMSAGGNGGASPILQRGRGGAIYAGAGSLGIFRVEPHKLISIATLNRSLSRPLLGQVLLPLYFAFGPNGTLYADDEPGGTAFEAHQQLLSISNGRASLLWQEKNAAPT
jgi:hypothetical protein